MKKFASLIALALFALIFSSCNSGKRPGKSRILVFSKTTGYRHSSIAAGKSAIIKLGQENGFEVDTTENAGYFQQDSLEKYSAVVFLNTTDVEDKLMDQYQENALERYIQAGGGYMGIHAATDAGYHWGWYGRLVGAHFLSHPEQQEATLNVVDKSHASTKHLPDQWKRKDEWYNFKEISPDIKVLITIDENSYKGGLNKPTHPMAWYHEFDGGRAYYTELGHTEESYTEDNYLKHILGGIQYAMGDNKKLDYSKAKTPPAPTEDRFTKTTLKQGVFFEPTEMSILPNLDIIICQRRGEILLYRNSDSSIKQVGFLNAYYKTDVPKTSAEEGVLGIKADPDFEKNHFIYIFYSPADTSVNRLSRFTLDSDTLNPASEKIILQFYSQRGICCHTGGSIAFGKDRQLFVSTGDNSTPFNEVGQTYTNRGFGPLDDRPGHQAYDARRSSGNTNDLRGKILRIHVNEDGSYTIPEGNLFKASAKTKPEIYVMGNRNPYRISVDKQTGFLYWGEVGPDASNDSLDTRGSRGYDELNQARNAGYFGWPLFVGNNYPYRAYDYATGVSGDLFDPAKPVNNSRNNTGLTELPPVQPAFIYYPYAVSKEFPQVGSGGRNAMAGPVYYTAAFPEATRLPEYYDGKLFIYDWIRGWIKVVTMKPDGDFDNMEPFMPSTKLASAIDIEVGPDGKLYVLEYGSGWFSKNTDAALSRIDYNSGDRAPKLSELQTDKTSGQIPLTVKLKISAKDPEGTALNYTWNLGNGTTQSTDVPELSYTYEKAGDYSIFVSVTDQDKSVSKSSEINVYAGNEAPQVSISLSGNKMFYFPGKPVKYEVRVKDIDDTSATDAANLYVSAEYMEGLDKAAMPKGHQVMTEAMMGKSLMMSLDCKACHQVDKPSIGPAYDAVAKKYAADNQSTPYLVNKIIKGGSGVWGETAMPAHPGLSESDARKIVNWIHTLKPGTAAAKSLPASGTVNPTLGQPVKSNGILYLFASYTDKTAAGIKPLTGSAALTLRNNRLDHEFATRMDGFTDREINGIDVVAATKTYSYFSMDSLDLSGVTEAEIGIIWAETAQAGYVFELRLDAENGKKLGEVNFGKSTGGKNKKAQLKTKIEPVTDGIVHNLYIVAKAGPGQEPDTIGLEFLRLDAK